MEASVVRRTRPNPDRLPDDHCIDWLPEAKHRYSHELPPFVEKNQGSTRAGLRKNVTLRVTDEQQQGLPVEAEIVCWSWSPQYTFGTIDVGGRRLIVKGDSSDRYRSYRSWHGLEKGFSHLPVAFGPWQKDLEDIDGPSINLKTQHANHVQMLSNPSHGRPQQTSINQYALQQEWGPLNLSPAFPLSPSSARPVKSSPDFVARRQYAQGQQHHIIAGYPYQPASPSIKDSPRPVQAICHNVQAAPATVHSDSQYDARAPIERVSSSGPKIDASSPRGREEHSSNGPCEVKHLSPSPSLSKGSDRIQEDRALSSKPNEDSAIREREQHYASAERTDERAISRQTDGKNPNNPTPHGPQYHGQDAAEPNPRARPTKRRRQTPTPNALNPTSPHLSKIMLSPSARSSSRPTPSTSSHEPSRFSTPTSLNPHPPTDSSLLLAPHKQSRTTLFIAIPLSTDTVPLKLRSCMTPSSFFAAVLAICAPPPGEADAVSGIRATFDWKREDEVDRAILLKLDFPDSFEVFLEIVDRAPCWGEEGGRCGVAVEVVLV